MNVLDLISDPAYAHQEPGKIYGVVIGLVTNNQDPEKRGRVKVKFPWLSDEDESHWARVAAPMAGNDRGTWFLPEVNDEVLVVFEHGDVRFPYVVGALWNGKDKPPRDNGDGNNDERVIRSRKGHELVFNDNSSGAKVEVTTAAGHKLILDDSSGGEKIVMEDKSGNKVTLDAVSNAIDVESNLSIKLKATNIDIEAGAMMNIKAGATLTIKGTMVRIN